jgi:hypothetical protein
MGSWINVRAFEELMWCTVVRTSFEELAAKNRSMKSCERGSKQRRGSNILLWNTKAVQLDDYYHFPSPVILSRMYPCRLLSFLHFGVLPRDLDDPSL